jgi:hypothetical protein
MPRRIRKPVTMTDSLVCRLRRLQPWLRPTLSTIPDRASSLFVPISTNSYRSVTATASYEKQRCGAVYLVCRATERGREGTRIIRLESPVRLGRRRLPDPMQSPEQFHLNGLVEIESGIPIA